MTRTRLRAIFKKFHRAPGYVHAYRFLFDQEEKCNCVDIPSENMEDGFVVNEHGDKRVIETLGFILRVWDKAYLQIITEFVYTPLRANRKFARLSQQEQKKHVPGYLRKLPRKEFSGLLSGLMATWNELDQLYYAVVSKLVCDSSTTLDLDDTTVQFVKGFIGAFRTLHENITSRYLIYKEMFMDELNNEYLLMQELPLGPNNTV
jgi:hypothetical protein